MRNYFNNKWNWVVIGAAIVLLLTAIYFVFITDTIVAEAKQEDKVYWCHTEPNGNFQTLHLPLSALQNAGHVNASGNPLHAGDYLGECVEPSVTPTVSPIPSVSITPSLTPSPTPVDCYHLEDGSKFRFVDDEVVPCPSITPSVAPTVAPSVTPTVAPTSVPTENKSETKSESKTEASQPQPTLIPCGPNTCGWK